MSTHELTLIDAIDDIRARDRRYDRNAYVFVVAALGVTVQALPDERKNDVARRHLSGRELLAGVVALARHEFGGFAPTVFREWGLQSNEDVGRIVFQLVRSGQLSARPEDSLEDFQGGADLLASLAAPPERTRPPQARDSGGASAAG